MTSLAHSGPLDGADLSDDRLHALDRFWWEIATELRGIGAALDRDPADLGRFLDRPGLRFPRYLGIPAAYRDCPDLPGDLLDTAASCRGGVVTLERAAYGAGPSASRRFFPKAANRLGQAGSYGTISTRMPAAP